MLCHHEIDASEYVIGKPGVYHFCSIVKKCNKKIQVRFVGKEAEDSFVFSMFSSRADHCQVAGGPFFGHRSTSGELKTHNSRQHDSTQFGNKYVARLLQLPLSVLNAQNIRNGSVVFVGSDR